MSQLLEFLMSGTVRRGLALLAAMLVPILNKKFGWNLSSEEVIANIGIAAGYIAQSAVKEAHSNGLEAAAAVKTPSDAAKVFADLKPPTIAPVAVKNELNE